PASRAGPRSTRPRSRRDPHRSPIMGKTSRTRPALQSLADAEPGEDRGDDLVVHAVPENLGERAPRVLEIDRDEIVGALLAEPGRRALERVARPGEQPFLARARRRDLLAGVRAEHERNGGAERVAKRLRAARVNRHRLDLRHRLRDPREAGAAPEIRL